MAQSHKDILIEWLQEAHAFAKHGETMLSGRTDALEDEYPELAARLREHVDETRAHQKELAALLGFRVACSSAGLDPATSGLPHLGSSTAVDL